MTTAVVRNTSSRNMHICASLVVGSLCRVTHGRVADCTRPTAAHSKQEDTRPRTQLAIMDTKENRNYTVGLRRLEDQ